MQVFLIAALTADGFIARSNDDKSFDWTSLADRKFYVQKIKQADAIVMGRKSFETFTRYPKDSRWLIYSSKPEDFKNPKPNIINAKSTSEPAKNLLARLKKDNCQQVAICGGQSIYSLFVKTGLVDTLYLTIEERVEFGQGVGLLNSESKIKNQKFGSKKIILFGFEYQLVNTKQLAEKTKLLEYKLIRN